MSSGVLSICISAGVPANPSTVSTSESTRDAIIVVDTAVFIALKSLAPNRREITTEQPTLLPTAMAMRIIVMGYDAPTAASALSPANLPAITLSAMLYSC